MIQYIFFPNFTNAFKHEKKFFDNQSTSRYAIPQICKQNEISVFHDSLYANMNE